MMFQALLVSTDDEAAAVLKPVLSGFGLSLHCCGHAEAIRELTEQKFDAVLVDFDDVQRAVLVLQNACLASPRSGVVTVALLRDRTQVRSAFGAGAHFVLYKPISPAQAQASLQAATILIKRERRRSLRVPVQVPVQLRVQNGLQVEGILLDLSEDGVEVLASQPLCPSASLNLQFILPDGATRIDARGEVAWANPNGQCGVRFVGLSQNLRACLRDWVTVNVQKLPPEELTAMAPCKLTDLSTGGCYVETASPFPERSGVVLRLKAAAMEVQAQGMVRVMHPGSGMGVEFASRTPRERDEAATFIKFLLSFPGTSPELTITPSALAAGMDLVNPAPPAAEEFEDPLLDLLRNHESLSQEDFLQELRKQRGLTAVAVC
jgi:CheY-like chemotaxis protein